jgi:hypothetical protein
MKLTPDDPAALAAAGRVSSPGKSVEGVALLRKVVALEPQSSTAHLELGMVLAESYDLGGGPPKTAGRGLAGAWVGFGLPQPGRSGLDRRDSVGIFGDGKVLASPYDAAYRNPFKIRVIRTAPLMCPWHTGTTPNVCGA